MLLKLSKMHLMSNSVNFTRVSSDYTCKDILDILQYLNIYTSTP